MQTKNSIMRKEIGLNRVKDCLGASLNAIDFFQKNAFLHLNLSFSRLFSPDSIPSHSRVILGPLPLDNQFLTI